MIAVTTHSRTRSLRYTLPMLLASSLIERELQDAPGCERYANVIAGPREFWTLTIWRDAPAMRKCMRDGTHGRLMWQQPHWLECYWGMRWRPGGYKSGEWEGEPWQRPEAHGSTSSSQTPKRPPAMLPWIDAALGGGGAAGATSTRRRSRRDLSVAHTALGNSCRAARCPAAAPGRFHRSRLVQAIPRFRDRRGAVSAGHRNVVRSARAPACETRT